MLQLKMTSKKNVRVNIFATVLLAVVMPIVIGQLLSKFVPITFVSTSIHSAIEAMGGLIAIVISMIFYMKYRNLSIITHFKM